MKTTLYEKEKTIYKILGADLMLTEILKALKDTEKEEIVNFILNNYGLDIVFDDRYKEFFS